MKKLFSAILATLLVLSTFSFVAFAADEAIVVSPSQLNLNMDQNASMTRTITTKDGISVVKMEPVTTSGDQMLVDGYNIRGRGVTIGKHNYVSMDYYYETELTDVASNPVLGRHAYLNVLAMKPGAKGFDSEQTIVANQWARLTFDISYLGDNGYTNSSGESGITQYHLYPMGQATKGNNANGTIYINNLTFHTEKVGIPTITGVSFAESEVEIEKGYSMPMPAVSVVGENAPMQEHTLTVAGHTSADTYLSNGTISVGEDETAESFTITATSVIDPTKSATLTVKVKNPAPRTPFDAENVLIRFGVVSDVHQNGYYAGLGNSNQVQEWVHAVDVLQQIAKDDGANLDAILIAGDMVDGVSNGGSNVGSFTQYGDKALQNMREVGHFAKGVWGKNTGVEFTGEKKVVNETTTTANGYTTATSVNGFGNGFDDETMLFYCLGNHDESGRGKSTAPNKSLDGTTYQFSTVYSADYFAAIICGWHHNPDSAEAKANVKGGTGASEDGFDHSYRQYIADLIDYNTNASTTVTAATFEAAYGVKLASADALFDKYYGHLDVKTTLTDKDNGISYGNMHMALDPNPDNATSNDRIHFIAIELSQANESCAWAEEIIKTSVAEDPSKPVFIISHYKPKGTMYGDTNYTRLSDVIKNYPQVIIWGGHSHTSMHNDNAINSELGFVAVETNTTRYMGTSTALTLEAMFGAGTSNNEKYPKSAYNYPSHEANVSNACYVEVDKNNNVRIRRVDLYRSYSTDFAENPTFFTQSKYKNFNDHAYNEEFVAIDEPAFIREPWDITDIETGKHLSDFNTTTRKEKTGVPYFDASSKITATPTIGGLDIGFKMDAKDDGMIMLYVLEIKNAANEVVHRRYYTNFYYEYPQDPNATYAGNNIAERDITASITGLGPATEYTVELFAVDDFYVAGAPISTKATTKDGDTKITLEDGRIAVFVDTTGETSMYEWTDGKEYLVYNSIPAAISTGADVIYLIKHPHTTNSLRDNVVGKQTKALEIIGIADKREDTVLSWANAVYLSTHDLTLTNVALNKEGSGDVALHVYNGHTLTLNDCIATGYALNIFTAHANNSVTGNLKVTGDTGKIANIWTNSTYSTSNTSVIGDVTLTLDGGVYSGDVHYMKMNSTAENPVNSLDGNLYINVSGGTFEKSLRGSTPNVRGVITKNSVVNVTGGTIAQLGNTGTSYVQGKEIYIVTDAVIATTKYTTSKDTSGNNKSILITVPANEGGIGEATVDAATGYITAYAIKQVEGKNSFVNGVAATSITLEEGKDYVVTYKTANAVQYDLNGGEGTAPETYVGTTGEVYNNLPDGTGFSRTNYNFVGWALTKDATEAITSVTIPAEGVVLYAVWAPKAYTNVVLNGNGGTVNGEASVKAFAGEVTALPTAYKAKSVFIGWSEDKDATEGSKTYTAVEGTNEVTLYAIYKEVGMDVIYVDTTAKTNGDGRTSEAPMNDWKAAMSAGSADGTMYVFKTTTIVSESATVGSGFNSAKGAIWLTNIDPATGDKYDSVAVFKTNGHYTTKAVTYDMPIASVNHTGMHINLSGNAARFTGNVSFIAKGAAIPGMTETCTSVPYFRGGSDSGNKPFSSITFDNLDIFKSITVYVGNQFGDTVTNANIIVNGGSVSKTFNMQAGLATIANVVVNDYSAAAEIKIDKAESCTTLNYILNNDTAELVTVPTGNNIYVVKSTSEGTVEPTETAGTFKITTEEDNIFVNGTKLEKKADNLYALGAAGTYDITYDATPRHSVIYKANGGEGADVTKTVKEGAAIDLSATVAAFTRAGYTLLGWNTDANATTALTELTMGTADVELYAVWAEKTHKVTYDMNGGEGDAPIDADVRETAAIELPTQVAFSRLGYEFLGWNTDKEATEALTSLTMGEEDVTLYAVWKEKTHKVTYNMNGGEGTAPEEASVREGLNVALPTEVSFTKAGHTFKGWAENAEATETLATLTMGKEDITLYAIWEAETYIVSFDTNGGKVIGELADMTKTYGVDLTLPTDYILYGTGLEFVGWSLNPDATAEEVVSTYTANEATTFFAIYNEVGTANVTPDEAADGTYYVITESDAEVEAPEFDIPGTATEVAKVDITLMDAATGTEVQPTAPVTFTIHCDEGALNGKAVYVYHVCDNPEFVDATVNGDDVTFTVDHLSTFVIYTVEVDAKYVLKGQYNNVTGLYTVSLYYNGKKANSGSFGFAYDNTVYALDAFTYAEGIDAVVETAHDEANAVVTGTWYPTTGAYLGGNDEDVLIGTFTFACDIADYDMTKAAERFYEFKADAAIDEIFDGTYYLYAVNSASDLEVTFAPIVTMDVVDLEPITVTYKASAELVTVRAGGDAPVSYAKAIVTTENGTKVAEFAIENAETATGTVAFSFETAPGAYNLTVVKNGYLEETISFNVTDGDLDIGEITPVPGDIRGNEADAQGDGKIDLADFVRVIRGFEYEEELKAHVDINEDGSVNVTDLGYVKANFNAVK